MKMDKRVALVLGGTGGIGQEIIKLLLKEGMDVCSTYHNQEKRDESLQGLSKETVSLYKMDLSDKTSVDRAFGEILKKHERIDTVVFSVTLPIENKPILKMEWEDFEKHINLQVGGLFNVVRNLKGQIRTKHKTKFIIILTEYCIGKPPSGLAHYVTAKYSLMGFAKSMAGELAKYNSTINMISPGMVNTDLLSKLPPKLVELTAENNPLKRIAVPKDVAGVVLFLAGENSDYLNGVNIAVNGGGVMM